jgi:hypothetical protein
MTTLADLVRRVELIQSEAIELDLSSCKPLLSGEFPRQVFESIGGKIVKINAPCHELSALPDSFATLSRLRILFFLGNRFVEIPRVVGQLPKLYMLSFKANMIAVVPEDSLPPSLTWLILTDNSIPRLPASIGSLTRLRKLMLASNDLESLPEEIALCRSLELVRLSNNRLKALPPGFLQLPRLAWVALAGNPLCSKAAAARAPAVGSSCRIDSSSVVLGPRLGHGASGTVYRGCVSLPHAGPTECAIKVFNATSSDGRPEDEVAAATALPPHPHLIRTLGFYEHSGPDGGSSGPSSGSLGLVMEIVDGTLLGGTPSFDSVTRDTFAPGATLSAVAALAIARGVAGALAHMHSHGYAHGDVYAHNILLTSPAHPSESTFSTPSPKLGDLGAAFPIPHTIATGIERVESRAFGCLLEDLVGLLPPPDVRTDIYSAEKAQGDVADRENTSELLETVRELLRRVAQLCTNDDPVLRPSFGDIVGQLHALP